MPEPTQKELDVLKSKAKLFDMIKERELYLNKANQLQVAIQKCVTELDTLEAELKEVKEGKIKEVK